MEKNVFITVEEIKLQSIVDVDIIVMDKDIAHYHLLKISKLGKKEFNLLEIQQIIIVILYPDLIVMKIIIMIFMLKKEHMNPKQQKLIYFIILLIVLSKCLLIKKI